MENKDLEFYKKSGNFTSEQIELIEELAKYRGVKLDVIADPDLTVDEIKKLAHLMINGASSDTVKDFIYYYRNDSFSEDQIGIIGAGFMQNVDVRSFANPLYTTAEMNNLRDLAYAEATERLNGRTILKVYAKKQIMEFNKKNNTNLSLSEINSIYSEKVWEKIVYSQDDDLTVYQAVKEGIIDKNEDWCKKYYGEYDRVYDTVLNISVDENEDHNIEYLCDFSDGLGSKFGSPISQYELKQLYDKYLEKNKNKEKVVGR